MRDRLLRMVEKQDAEGIKSLLSGRIPDVDLKAIVDAVRRGNKGRAKTLINTLGIEDLPAESIRMRLRLLPPKRENPKRDIEDLLVKGLAVGAIIALVAGTLYDLFKWVRRVDEKKDEELIV